MKKIIVCFLFIIVLGALGTFVYLRFFQDKSPEVQTERTINLVGESTEVQNAEEKEIYINNGIGRTVNAITGAYGVVTAEYPSIFSNNSVKNFKLMQTSIAKNEVSTFSSNSVTEQCDKMTQSVSINASVSSSYKLYKASFAAGLTANTSKERTENTKDIYINMINNIDGKLIEVDGRRDISKFTSIVSDEFLAKAKRITDKNTAEDFINSYGTHLVTAAVYGARAEYVYSYSYESESETRRVDTSVNGSFTSAIKKFETGTNVGSSIASTMGWSDEISTESFHAILRGGRPVNTTSIESLSESYSEWLNSFADGNFNEIVDFGSNSLIALSDLMPATDDYTLAKSVLNTIIEELINEEYRKAINSLKKANTGEPNGSKINPYLINSRQEFIEIMNNPYKNAGKINYKLTCDLDFADYMQNSSKPLFSSLFCGLNGNNKTVKNFSLTSEKNYNGELGLFGFIENDASLSYLNFSNNKIIYTPSSEFNGVKFLSAGICCGVNNGTISHCSFDNNTINIDDNKYLNVSSIYIGTVCGQNYGGVIQYCTANHSTLNGDSDTVKQNITKAVYATTICEIGGICGLNKSKDDKDVSSVSNCSSSDCTITGRTRYLYDKDKPKKTVCYVGGIIGCHNSNAKETGNLPNASSNSLSSKYIKVTYDIIKFSDKTFDAPKGDTIGKVE